ncbi:MAG TPA: cupin domain-containing protein [Polyangiaceae bacterium]|nr:cupin domain-containing protein [Polyangiaceae bacterium]
MTQNRRHPNVINQDEVEPFETQQGKFHMRARQLGRSAGNEQLGAQVLELAPGECAFPFHFHCAKEEAIYVLSGRGTVRLGDERVPVRAGDWIAHPAGPTHAHQMINDSEAPLVYLAISTQQKCEIVGYPDSNKMAFFSGPSFNEPWARQIVRKGETLGYYDDEPDAR